MSAAHPLTSEPKGAADAAPWETREFLSRADSEGKATDPPARVCQVGKTQLSYRLRCIEDLHAMLKADGDWVPLGAADEQKPGAEGTVEAWGRSPDNPVGGWYGLKKGLRGRLGMYVPPLLEALGLAELEHNARNNRMRAYDDGLIPSRPDVADGEAIGERVALVEHVFGEPRDPRPAGERWHHGGSPAHLGLLDEPADEPGAEDPLVNEVLVQAELALRMQRSHRGAGAGPARGAVDRADPGLRAAPVQRAGRDDHAVAPGRSPVPGRTPELRDRDALDPRVLGVDGGELFARSGLDHLADPDDGSPFLWLQTQAEPRRLGDH